MENMKNTDEPVSLWCLFGLLVVIFFLNSLAWAMFKWKSTTNRSVQKTQFLGFLLYWKRQVHWLQLQWCLAKRNPHENAQTKADTSVTANQRKANTFYPLPPCGCIVIDLSWPSGLRDVLSSFEDAWNLTFPEEIFLGENSCTVVAK